MTKPNSWRKWPLAIIQKRLFVLNKFYTDYKQIDYFLKDGKRTENQTAGGFFANFAAKALS